jgi:redoxin
MSKRWITVAGLIFFFVVVFCAGFFFFKNRIERSQAESPPDESNKSLIDKPFPLGAQLVDTDGAKVDEQILRKGRVVVVFITTDCDACLAEGKFLQTVIDRRSDVTFYGVVPFGTRPDSSNNVEKTFPFRVFYDEANSFVMTIGINRVPVKVFLEDGIIRKGWIGAALTDKAKTSFVAWLDGLPSNHRLHRN